MEIFLMLNKIIIAVFIILLSIVIYLVYDQFTEAEYSLATEAIDTFWDPEQTNIENIALPTIIHGKTRFFCTALATYKHRGQIVSTRRYRKGYMSDLSPWDYATVWGIVPSLLEHLKFKQMIRYCLFEYKYGAPLDPEYVQSHMANNHLIPSTENIRRALSSGKKGDKVILEGYLVNVQAFGAKGSTGIWKSSLVRTDKGGGACEIIYLTKLQINDKIYE